MIAGFPRFVSNWCGVRGIGGNLDAVILELQFHRVRLVAREEGDTLHDAEFKFEGEQVEGFMRAFEADFAGTCASFVDQMFPEEDVEE